MLQKIPVIGTLDALARIAEAHHTGRTMRHPGAVDREHDRDREDL